MGIMKSNVFVIVMLVLNMQSFFVFAHVDHKIKHECPNVSSLPAPYNNFTGNCVHLWESFFLRFHQNADNVVTFVLSTKYISGWVGMGFSIDGTMVESSAMVGWVDNKGRPTIVQYILHGYIAPEVIPDKGDLPLTKVPPAVLHKDDKIYLAFQLKYSKPLETKLILLAHAMKVPDGKQLSKHDHKMTVIYNFLDKGQHGKLLRSTSFRRTTNLRRFHGIVAIVAWGLVLPAGAIVARYFRHYDHLWLNLHMFFQSVGFIIGTVAVVAGVALYPQLPADIGTHASAGALVLMLSILQVMAMCVRPDKVYTIRKYWNWYHHWVGRFSLFMAATNIISGIRLQGIHTSWEITYAIMLSFLVLFVIILEVLLRMRRSEELPDIIRMNSI